MNEFSLARSPLGGSPHLMLSEQQIYTHKHEAIKHERFKVSGIILTKKTHVAQCFEPWVEYTRSARRELRSYVDGPQRIKTCLESEDPYSA